ncbi:MAG: hypothetical protein J1F42_03645 [Lachnospiraceae bacterium]|nr:hypothetical protein [Lachnospiraceae bacterium]
MSTYFEWEDEIRFQVRENKTALVCGVLAVGVAVFIMIMRFLHPSAKGGGTLLYLPILCMLLGGVACFMMYYNRKLTVEQMDICYVNWMGKAKQFTLDEIGYCKIGTAGDMNQVVLYDLLGKKLCKLEIGMRGLAELYQYLIDNGIRIERAKSKTHQLSGFVSLIDVIGKETAVCEEEICKCSESFYEDIAQVFRDWEKRNKHFGAVWEIGFAEYTADDLERKCPLHMYPSSVEEPLEHIPDSYECVLEAYLKTEDGYVVNKRGETVSIMLPYLSQTKSYQIGEKTRIRKTDEEWMKEWLRWHLCMFDKELPKHKYHTEYLNLGHKLRPSAGIAAKPLSLEKNQA